jgi:hypothetical protein
LSSAAENKASRGVAGLESGSRSRATAGWGTEEGLAMKHRSTQSVLATSLIGLGLLVTGGCPMAMPLVDDPMLAPEPGTYYVDLVDGKLCYYKLPQTRDDDSGWVALNDDGPWYEGPGFYELSEDYEWSWDEDAEGLTLDEFIQLHDPLPAVPDPS